MSTHDPQLDEALRTVRQSTEFFDAALARLERAEHEGGRVSGDDVYDQPSLLPGWRRRHVIAHVAANARAFLRLAEWARTGTEHPMYPSREARDAEIESLAARPALELRCLHRQGAAELDGCWRDATRPVWEARVRTAQGADIPFSETVWMRARELWLHAVDLDAGLGFEDVPPEVLARLLRDITGHWSSQGADDGPAVRLEVTDHPELAPEVPLPATGGEPALVRGTLAAVVGWASGRDASGLDAGAEVPAPRWL
ncbi:maleylpyruvate isomerase family mycothiol-dependent enzyme [Sediminivirga luteola]|jgi:maleylpyruvate isomerase|uniref:Maleylpyruvate isomerase n=1 Tax=Sediminivirga luteola TaxID=1774748 RepID=A0A8J2TXD5_9MICO|nr:maleylpyruvate isomerase family mycothiol-dependent enzyme [Sediminivirga luteola]MCI2266253.1 maleylpyruvate isomerase family mycothiol-dependent enzyme [Sediminivirga luteola]GGA12112.1 maleylpyruvate isomerase [Sediminivirga luteola]